MHVRDMGLAMTVFAMLTCVAGFVIMQSHMAGGGGASPLGSAAAYNAVLNHRQRHPFLCRNLLQRLLKVPEANFPGTLHHIPMYVRDSQAYMFSAR